MIIQTSKLAVSLDVSAIHTTQKQQVTDSMLIATIHEHSLLPGGRLARPLRNVKYTLNCHAHTRHSFETRHLLT